MISRAEITVVTSSHTLPNQLAFLCNSQAGFYGSKLQPSVRSSSTLRSIRFHHKVVYLTRDSLPNGGMLSPLGATVQFKPLNLQSTSHLTSTHALLIQSLTESSQFRRWPLLLLTKSRQLGAGLACACIPLSRLCPTLSCSMLLPICGRIPTLSRLSFLYEWPLPRPDVSSWSKPA